MRSILIAGIGALLTLGQAGNAWSADPYYLLEVDQGKGLVQYVMLLSPKIFAKKSIPPQALVGQLRRANGQLNPDNFVRNRGFVELMQQFIEREGPQSEELKKEAAQLKAGSIRLVDGRSSMATPGGVPSDDTLGVFSVQGGRIVGYQPNPEHRIVSERGLFHLPFRLHDKFVKELESKFVDR
jgi:hypothetical protein